ncbi:hypothetical protein B0T26DRAFT_743851 [Lasiosphaeria miniovina]|uniref:BTB domain-containing protein n=1 Tax=Lasiosphaeria miniovina TaxID=1954250 RepID=A0AA39ZZQ7_9PEZI|nr:uncharacterized protein B0T26DRAFT_743851 [Lasiosphaeria miniovina]KAK0706658.1 hypothetical protein B0T26DRAFT_743851 [Lasiosphaeria miniovina]
MSDSTSITDNSSITAEPDVVQIVPDGNVLLDVTFETSRAVLRAARRASKSRPGLQVVSPTFKPKVRLRYRVRLEVLKQHSKYFFNLLGDTRFSEGKSIADAFARLALRHVNPSDAEAKDLPVVQIHEDDEATKTAGQEAAFEGLLRVLHAKDVTTKPVTMQYLATLAILADRFDCALPVSKYLIHSLKYKWPATQTRLSRDDGPALTRAAEETLRQKILVSWLLDQPLKMPAATRELIMYGSRKWSALHDDEEAADGAMWWDLPDGLEHELQYRRQCIVNTIASSLRHFLQLYSSRVRQCKLGYDSSANCDSYQLGEMIKFLFSRDMLSLVDFSSNSFGGERDHATDDLGHIIATLKQCPSYQIDKNHTNCGLRTRIIPILDYIQAMLSSNIVPIARHVWKNDRDSASWLRGSENDQEPPAVGTGGGDQRLRYEGALASDRAARALFTADRWDWTPEY